MNDHSMIFFFFHFRDAFSTTFHQYHWNNNSNFGTQNTANDIFLTIYIINPTWFYKSIKISQLDGILGYRNSTLQQCVCGVVFFFIHPSFWIFKTFFSLCHFYCYHKFVFPLSAYAQTWYILSLLIIIYAQCF